MNECDIITKVDDEVLFDESQWIRGQFRSADGRSCLIGAINVACGYPTGMAPGAEPVAEHTARHRVLDAVRHVLLIQYRRDDIMGWNDARYRTFDDVKKVIKAARERLCQ